MNADEIMEYCLHKEHACLDRPWDNGNILIKIAGHYFCGIYENKGRAFITVKGNKEDNLALREMYKGIIVRGWHCPERQQPYNNTIYLDGDIGDDVIRQLIDISYEYVRSGLSKKEKENIAKIR